MNTHLTCRIFYWSQQFQLTKEKSSQAFPRHPLLLKDQGELFCDFLAEFSTPTQQKKTEESADVPRRLLDQRQVINDQLKPI